MIYRIDRNIYRNRESSETTSSSVSYSFLLVLSEDVLEAKVVHHAPLQGQSLPPWPCSLLCSDEGGLQIGTPRENVMDATDRELRHRNRRPHRRFHSSESIDSLPGVQLLHPC